MCGIVAVVGNWGHDAAAEAAALRALVHRGPDTSGEWRSSDRSVWLGHRRLSIVDLSDAGRQPMHNEDETIWLVCNGEIYNYPDLRARLERSGHTFLSHSDNEVILHAYEAWGDGAVEQLEGMFAFVLWDERRRRILSARDRLGIKPLYYSVSPRGLVMASEAGALLPLLESRPALEPMALAYVMTLGYVPSPWSVWHGVHKLEPGHMLVWQGTAGVQQRRYWEPPRQVDPDRKPHEGEWADLFCSVLKDHLLSDVPIGLFMSGGLDSSCMAAGLRDIGRPVQALTVSFPGPKDEAPIAAATARHLHVSHRAVTMQVEDIDALIDQVSGAFDEPQGYSALLSMHLISRAAAQDFKVVLAGDGGDELFGGYTWYRQIEQRPSRLSRCIRRCVRPLVRINSAPWIRRQAALHFARSSVMHRHAWRLYPRFLPEEAESLLAPTGLRFGDEEMLAPLRKHVEPGLPLRRALQRVDLMTFCTDSILAKVDRASMAHSLEVRVPFLDRRLVEFALPSPPTAAEQIESKPILRDYLRRRVPAEVLNHPKQGFSLRVLDDFDWDAAVERIRQGTLARDGYWSPGWERLLQSGVPYRTGRIWNLLLLTRWADTWLREKGKAHA